MLSNGKPRGEEHDGREKEGKQSDCIGRKTKWKNNDWTFLYIEKQNGMGLKISCILRKPK